MAAERLSGIDRSEDWWDGLAEGRRRQTDTIRASLSQRVEEAELHWREVADRSVDGWLTTRMEGKHAGLSFALSGVEGRYLASIPDRRHADRREEEGYALGERVQVALDNEQHRDPYHLDPGANAARMIRNRAATAQAIAHHHRARRRAQHDRALRRPAADNGREDREEVGERGR